MIIIKQPLNFFPFSCSKSMLRFGGKIRRLLHFIWLPTSLQLRAPLTKLKVAMQPIYYTNQTERRAARLNEEGNNGTAN